MQAPGSTKRAAAICWRAPSAIGPATDETCMYFRSLVRNYRVRDQLLTTRLRNANASIFAEDRIVVEAQQRSISTSSDESMHNLNIDAESVWARRNIEVMIECESRTERESPKEPMAGTHRGADLAGT
ncbi:MAG: hypothetical protein WCE38_02380 [Burkholderiales bacterium]